MAQAYDRSWKMAMFKVPSFTGFKSKEKPLFEGLSTFHWGELTEKNEIGKGSFGSVITARRADGETIVVKRLYRDNERAKRLFAKEARILNGLSNRHIVKFKAISTSPVAMMLEYLYFDFEPFGTQGRVSSLEGFLDFVGDERQCVDGFSTLHSRIAEHVALGLDYLHSKDIVHRDLKPANVLVSNQHYCGIKNKAEFDQAFSQEPVICKLVDFGESRSALNQTATLCQTKPNNFDRGTLIYNAPELLSGNTSNLSIEHLKKTDIWSLGMLFFMLLNPDLPYPY